MAEAVKTAILFDPALLDWIEERSPREPGDLGLEDREELVFRCQSHKARVVSADERESGERRLLNLGHTLGHALETATGHGEALLHGEAVAIGMVVAARLAERRAVAPPGTASRIRAVIERLGLPVEPPPGIDPAVLLSHMRQDKKRSGGASIWVLLASIGRAVIVPGIEDGELLDLLG
jgi:3-dehydroquinate synthase